MDAPSLWFVDIIVVFTSLSGLPQEAVAVKHKKLNIPLLRNSPYMNYVIQYSIEYTIGIHHYIRVINFKSSQELPQKNNPQNPTVSTVVGAYVKILYTFFIVTDKCYQFSSVGVTINYD